MRPSGDVVANSEDETQASITAVTVGGPTRLRLTKLVTAYVGCVGLAPFATVLPLALQNHSDRATPAHVGAGLIAHLLVAGAESRSDHC
jgi:hypothetical protein